ncbi:MAG: hypothetical protein PHH00_02325 [Candidatus Nanoarchaeia archaeon]|nr:hypothetical protein [Candidatus Nanoarchaeia archaeon]
MKYYIAYRFTGEDPKELEKILGDICSSLNKIGHTNYCSFFDPSMGNIGNKNVIIKAFRELDKSDALFVFIKSEEKSEGMLIEIGYALSKKKKIILLIKKGVKTTFVREIADRVIEFNDFDDLRNKLGELEI